jgi:hypothetical protein
MNPASRSLYKTRKALGEICDREIVCSDRGMMRGTAVGATGDALEEFNEALSDLANFEARDYSSIAESFSRRIINLSADCGIARNAGRSGTGRDQ